MDERAQRSAAIGAASAIPPALIGVAWMLVAGLLFGILNTIQKFLAHQIHPPEVACLRFFAGSLVLLPLAARAGWRIYWPRRLRLHIFRGLIHVCGAVIWFSVLPFISLAQNAAIGFTAPIFTMLGAWVFLGEKMHTARWLAVGVAFGGVLIVVWPGLVGMDVAGIQSILLVVAAAIFAGSFLISKALTRHDTPEAIVFWLGIVVGTLMLPFAIVGIDWTAGEPTLHYAWQWPTAWEWGLVLGCGLFGSAAHYCMMRAFHIADVSAVQPVRFFDLVWASLFGLIVFGQMPTVWALVGGSIICGSTLWIARYERRRAQV